MTFIFIFYSVNQSDACMYNAHRNGIKRVFQLELLLKLTTEKYQH